MVDLSSFKGIIFDMDGTLVDSMGAHVKAWEITCEEFNYPFDPEYHHSLGGVPTHKTAELLNARFNRQHNPATVAAFKKHTYDQLGHLPTLIDDTMKVFRQYIKSHPIAVGTGSDRKHAEWVLNHFNILEQLDALVTCDDVSNGKPHPETFLLAAKKMNVAPEHCVVFEDTNIGRQAAIDAGMTCIMVQDGKIADSPYCR